MYLTKIGIDYLINTRGGDGGWVEEPLTGTGFPKVFYLKYHYYCLYFPLLALARHRRLTEGRSSRQRQAAFARYMTT